MARLLRVDGGRRGLVMPLASAPTIPGSSRVPGRPRWKVADLASPSSRQDRLVDERKDRRLDEGQADLGLGDGRLPLEQAGQALGFAVGEDDRVVDRVDRPSVVQVQLCTSPVARPGGS